MHPCLHAVGAVDLSGTMVPEMLAALPPLEALPKDAATLAALLSGERAQWCMLEHVWLGSNPGQCLLTWFPHLLADRTGLRIPVPDSTHASLRLQLTAASLELLVPVVGYHKATAAFAGLISDQPDDVGQEMTTTCAMKDLLTTTFKILNTFSNIHLPVSVQLNRTELGAGSRSGAVLRKARPDTLVVYNMATLMIGEDRPDRLDQAVKNLKGYVEGGLGAEQYGAVPGILGYAASGLMLLFYFISQAGEVGVPRHCPCTTKHVAVLQGQMHGVLHLECTAVGPCWDHH